MSERPYGSWVKPAGAGPGGGDCGRGRSPGDSYTRAGVDIEAGNEAVRRLTPHARRTYIPGVLGDIGGFGGLFALEPGKYREPVLVAGADGVGTKLKIAFATGIHDTIGIDCVAMNVDDVIVQGARPLFFLDYLAVGKLEPAVIESIVKGVADGCVMAGCALLGGETAEMPGFYAAGEYDLAGFAVGVVEKGGMIDGSRIRRGDAIVGLMSSGLHSNGYSLARRVLLDEARLRLDSHVDELGRTLGEEMLEPTRIYSRVLAEMFDAGAVDVLGLVHVTGGGFFDNIPRILPEGCRAAINLNSWEVPPVFRLIQRLGGIAREEMYRVFNMGIGMVAVVRPDQAGRCVEFLSSRGFPAALIGEVRAGDPGVDI
ncbi:MAG: phosphoribosylformylglycinamidine cyclo-ligase [Firmicutes bacterium]|nr:phosphoribosylformylglycinamidine cyclo-ligase [Bacillota bacterium]